MWLSRDRQGWRRSTGAERSSASTRPWSPRYSPVPQGVTKWTNSEPGSQSPAWRSDLSSSAGCCFQITPKGRARNLNSPIPCDVPVPRHLQADFHGPDLQIETNQSAAFSLTPGNDSHLNPVVVNHQAEIELRDIVRRDSVVTHK